MADVIQATSSLSDPSHSGEHNRLNADVGELQSSYIIIKDRADQAATDIRQARMVTDVWAMPGPVVTGSNLLIPIVWNLTDRASIFHSAMATVLTPPQGQDIVLEFVMGTALTSDQYDELTMSLVLNSPLRIPADNNTSAILTSEAGDFPSDLEAGSFLALRVRDAGADPDYGADLTVQLTRIQ